MPQLQSDPRMGTDNSKKRHKVLINIRKKNSTAIGTIERGSPSLNSSIPHSPPPLFLGAGAGPWPPLPPTSPGRAGTVMDKIEDVGRRDRACGSVSSGPSFSPWACLRTVPSSWPPSARRQGQRPRRQDPIRSSKTDASHVCVTQQAHSATDRTSPIGFPVVTGLCISLIIN